MSYPITGANVAGTGPNGDKVLFSRMRMWAYGVHFRRKDVEKIIAATNPQVAIPEIPQSNAGRKQTDLWGRWIVELIRLHEVEVIENWTANKIITEIERRVPQGEIPSYNTVRLPTVRILDLLRRGEP